MFSIHYTFNLNVHKYRASNFLGQTVTVGCTSSRNYAMAEPKFYINVN